MTLQPIPLAISGLFLLASFSLPTGTEPSANCEQPVSVRQADVVIYGGTSAAVIAAVQVKKMGKSVIVVSPDKHLGGLSAGGLGFTDTGNKLNSAAESPRRLVFRTVRESFPSHGSSLFGGYTKTDSTTTR